MEADTRREDARAPHGAGETWVLDAETFLDTTARRLLCTVAECTGGSVALGESGWRRAWEGCARVAEREAGREARAQDRATRAEREARARSLADAKTRAMREWLEVEPTRSDAGWMYLESPEGAAALATHLVERQAADGAREARLVAEAWLGGASKLIVGSETLASAGRINQWAREQGKKENREGEEGASFVTDMDDAVATSAAGAGDGTGVAVLAWIEATFQAGSVGSLGEAARKMRLERNAKALARSGFAMSASLALAALEKAVAEAPARVFGGSASAPRTRACEGRRRARERGLAQEAR